MQLSINPTKRVYEFQQEFNKLFPFLRIEFLGKTAGVKTKNDSENILSDQLPIGKCQLKIVDGQLEFTQSTKVKELEKLLKDDFGLNAQVFRKSGKIWLETTLTDEWTLQKQNEHGQELSKPPAIERPEDFDLSRDT